MIRIYLQLDVNVQLVYLYLLIDLYKDAAGCFHPSLFTVEHQMLNIQVYKYVFCLNPSG
jgi:hypothetical protein